ncbi:polypyrimidine tract-binding protein homolog 3 isoform X3 [Selaginella moellendorffii]|uniref:polypyrimidine tract-binding protein homolog 3 isoform X3 n=1 Tax=Selaginella moellendorffii TaxID=88036 RepID=UPI000D1CC961|nr:polypyrimidine tract-binding protein homolog 3 isoform X3 [Selaginella moellendorffii]|eukprot:XP_024521602.1 polypyrimidine tract-binding protein homolog 3 isoform X3 [Selaginella moellendorffii]
MLRPRRCYHRFACGAYPREPELPNPSPCKVLHLRNLAQDVAEDDLVELVRPFGRVSGIVLLRTWNQAFVQMQDIAKAFLVIRHFASRQATVRGRDVSIQFSARKELYPAEETCSAILLVTMLDSVCHVTVDALHQTFKSFGPIEKIAIFPQSTVLAQALIQYASPRDAREAKHRLHKSKILNGSCTMEIQYSRTDEVRVACNNDLSRDFTNSSLPSARFPSILGAGNVHLMKPGVRCPTTNQRCVLLLSNLNTRMINEHKLYNLFSVYGNVLRIKGSFVKPELALVQMSDGFQADLAMACLKGVSLFGKKMEITLSDHSCLRHPHTHFYSWGTGNRFLYAYAKKCCPPTKVIHASNLVPDIQEVDVVRHFAEHGVIVKVEVSQAREGRKRREALVEFTSVESATEAIACKQWSSLRGARARLVYWRFHAFSPGF